MLNKRRITAIALIAGSFLGLAACTTNPYTGQTQLAKTGMGAGLGAATGAVLGQVIGHNTAATLIGAGIGAAVGGGIGAYMDNQESELRQQLASSGVRVVRVGNDIQLIMPGDITFATDSANINARFYNALNSVAIVMKKFDRTTARVVGYTDNTGTTNHNQLLSEQRAQSVSAYLISQGVNSNRFNAVGMGERNPVASNGNAEGRAQNRRVEITLHAI